MQPKNFKLFSKLFLIRFQQNNLPQAAGYLTYSTMLAFVPLLMVVFSIFSHFPLFAQLSGRLQNFVYSNFSPTTGDIVGHYLQQFVENSRQMSAIGIISLFFVALLLIHSIDVTLNKIWRNTHKRPLLYSFGIYWLILIIGPILMAVSLAVTSYVTLFASHLIPSNFSLPFGINFLKIVPFFITWIIFTFIYLIVPNTKINWRDSAVGALVAAVFFTLGKKCFNWYIVTFPSYHLIYGAMATLPILLLWLQLSWLAILLGAQLAAALQDLRTMRENNLTFEQIKEQQ